MSQTQRPVVEFPANSPVELSLKYATARAVGDGTRALFTTTDDKALFLDLEVARQVEAAGIQPKERFTITRKQASAKERSTWEVQRLAGEQPNGTYVLPKPPEQPEAAPAPKPPARAASLVEEANSLVDAYAEVLDRGLKLYQGKVKPDEIRALTISAYISRSKLSSVA